MRTAVWNLSGREEGRAFPTPINEEQNAALEWLVAQCANDQPRRAILGRIIRCRLEKGKVGLLAEQLKEDGVLTGKYVTSQVLAGNPPFKRELLLGMLRRVNLSPVAAKAEYQALYRPRPRLVPRAKPRLVALIAAEQPVVLVPEVPEPPLEPYLPASRFMAVPDVLEQDSRQLLREVLQGMMHRELSILGYLERFTVLVAQGPTPPDEEPPLQTKRYLHDAFIELPAAFELAERYVLANLLKAMPAQPALIPGWVREFKAIVDQPDTTYL